MFANESPCFSRLAAGLSSRLPQRRCTIRLHNSPRVLMTMTAKTVSELADLVGGRVLGSNGILVQRVAALESATEGDIAYVEDEKFFGAAGQTEASCLLVPEGAGI